MGVKDEELLGQGLGLDPEVFISAAGRGFLAFLRTAQTAQDQDRDRHGSKG